jgi:Mg-chelatase subunit ChlD
MRKSSIFLLALIAAFSFLLVVGPSAAQTQDQYVSVNKYLSSSTIGCDDQVKVTLVVTGTRPVRPVDVILVIDRSGSMLGTPLRDAKNAAKAFVDMLHFTSDPSTTDKVGVVSYSTWGRLDIGLTNDKEAVKAKIESLTAGGFTNIGDAVFKAQAELNISRPFASDVMIVLSDGVANRDHAGHECISWPTRDTTCTLDAVHQAAAAKSLGTTIFTIGLNLDDVERKHPGSGLLGESTLQRMASGSSYYFRATESGYLMEIYERISGMIAPAASDLVIVDFVTPGFEVVPGTVDPEGAVNGNVTDGYVIVWTFDVLGDETRYFTYNITRDPDLDPGLYNTNIEAALNYADWQGNPAQLMFPNPQIEVVGYCGGGQVIVPPLMSKSGPQYAHVGDTITYTYWVNNTGEVPLIITAEDNKTGPLSNPSGDDGNGTLDPGEKWMYTAQYTVLDTDPDPLANELNVAYTGDSNEGWDVRDWVVDILHPVIQIEKTANVTEAEVGDPVRYNYTVTNTGDTPLYNVNVTDNKASPFYVTGDDGDGVLEVGERWNYTATYIVAATDGDSLVNVAYAEGKDILGMVAMASDTVSITVLQPQPQASVWISDSNFCLLDNNVFRVVITPKKPAYKISSTNPGQFYLNIIVPYSGGRVNITSVIPPDFRVKNGQRGVHIYSSALSYQCSGATWRPDYGSDITSMFTISVEKLGETGGFREQHPMRVVVLNSTELSGISEIYVTIHLEYALRGMKISSGDFGYFDVRSYDFNVYVNDIGVGSASITSTSKLPHIPGPRGLEFVPPGQAKKD